MNEGVPNITAYGDTGGSEPGELDIYCAHVLSEGKSRIAYERYLGSGQTLHLCEECGAWMRDRLQEQLSNYANFVMNQALLGNK